MAGERKPEAGGAGSAPGVRARKTGRYVLAGKTMAIRSPAPAPA